MEHKSPLLEPLGEGKSELRELGSRFLGFAFPVHTEEDYEGHLAALHKIYSDATHICYAFRHGIKGENYRAADAGEPKYSAGVPILNQIKANQLTNVLVAVVRYYGGTNLGVGGLVKAYGEAAEHALANLPTQTALESFQFTLEVEPSQAGIVYNWARKEKYAVQELSYSQTGHVLLEISGKGDRSTSLAQIQARLG